MSDTPRVTAEGWRKVLTEQGRTALTLKIARAQSVLRNLDRKQAEMWARVELETQEEAEAAWQADVEAKVLWAVHGLDIGAASAQIEADLF